MPNNKLWKKMATGVWIVFFLTCDISQFTWWMWMIWMPLLMFITFFPLVSWGRKSKFKVVVTKDLHDGE